MKNLIILHLLLLSTMSFAQTEEILKIEFKSMSRGSQEYVLISSEEIYTKKESFRETDKKNDKRNIKKKEWTNLLEIAKNITLSDIPNLKSPTMKRAYDGAMHSEIRITTKNNTYSHLFDNEDPHDNLKPLMAAIVKLKN